MNYKRIMPISVHTADDEIPNCNNCDNVCICTDKYCQECGENFWAHFRHTIYVEIKEELL